MLDSVSVDSQGIFLELTGTERAAKGVTVYKDGEKVASYKISAVKLKDLPDGVRCLEALDLNFDGRMDFRVLSSVSRDEYRYQNFICNSDYTYYSHKELDALVNPVPDAENGYITSRSYVKRFDSAVTYENIPRTYHEAYSTHRYVWEQSSLCEVARNSIVFYSESNIYCVGKYRLDQYGDLAAVNEDWLHQDKLDEMYGDTGYYLPITD